MVWELDWYLPVMDGVVVCSCCCFWVCLRSRFLVMLETGGLGVVVSVDGAVEVVIRDGCVLGLFIGIVGLVGFVGREVEEVDGFIAVEVGLVGLGSECDGSVDVTGGSDF